MGMAKEQRKGWGLSAVCGVWLGLGALSLAQQPLGPRVPGEVRTSTGIGTGGGVASPLAQPSLSPGVLFLFDLERRFAASVAAGGGKVFATWFADDAVTLNNGKAAVLGRGNIAAQTNWSAAEYQLTWVPEGGQMMPSNDAGFTWGRYEGRGKDRQGGEVVTSGRYITLWKKTADGEWKVAMDASADGPAGAGACCVLPKP